jgi:hypothetical protein
MFIIAVWRIIHHRICFVYYSPHGKIPIILTDPRTHQTPQQIPRNRRDREDYTNNTIGLQKTKQAPTMPPYHHNQNPPEFLLLIPPPTYRN